MKKSVLACVETAPRFCFIEPLEARIAPATFVVTNTSASNIAGSFLSALNQANATPNVGGPDVVAFNIPGSGPFVILPVQSYAMTEAVIIDGFTQPGSSANTLAVGDDAVMKITINGSSAGAGVVGLSFSANADGSVVRGLVFDVYNNGASTAVRFDAGSDGNTIEGCYIGINASATAAGNYTGVLVQGSNCLIGGTTPAARNVISGNLSTGIVISGAAAKGNLVEGNYIGLNPSGTAAIGNAIGLNVDGATGTHIGGATAEERNVVSGNGANPSFSPGIQLSNNASDSHIEGNFVGLNATGDAAIGNYSGIGVFNAPRNVIGGTTPGVGNFVSGNTSSGISISGAGSTGAIVQGNFVGMDATGGVGIGNGQGILVNAGATNALIGGTTAGSGNVVVANGFIGINVATGGGAYGGNVVQGNYVGTDLTTTLHLGNGYAGIVVDTTHDNSIGGTVPGAGNIVAFNLGPGVLIVPDNAVDNAIRGNSIHDNTGLGIELSSGSDRGPNPNDRGDGDVGPNMLQNSPVLLTANVVGSGVAVSGFLNTTATVPVAIDLFANSPLGTGGFVEGEIYLGQAFVVTDGFGNATFSATLPGNIPAGYLLTATATSLSTAPFGNTSEFSQAIAVNANPTPAITIGDVAVVEGDSGVTAASFSVALSIASSQTVTVDFTTTHGTTSSADILAQNGTLTFLPGETSKTISVAVLSDTLDEFDEFFAVNLSAPQNATIEHGQGIGTVTDDDAAPAFAVSDAALREGDAGEANAVFTVTLSAASGKETRVAFSTAAGSAGTDDFHPLAGMLVFAPGETSKTVAVPILGDRLVETDETFALNLIGVTNASIGNGIGTGLIQNDDQTGVGANALNFNAATSYEVGAGPASVATGDVNGDGRLDLVSISSKTGTVSVLLGAADGTFAGAVSFATGGKTPNRVVLGDFDGINGLDIAVSHGGSKNIGLLLNDGSGVFGAPALIPAGTKPGALHASDLDGDGDLDLIVTNSANSVFVLPGNGNGTFAAGVKYSSGGTLPVDLGTGDFNGDGFTDIAVVNAGSKTVRLLLGDGSSAFTPSAKSFKVGLGASALAVGDLNGDSIADIAVAHTASRCVSVLLGQSGMPGSELRSQLKVATPGLHLPRAIAIADLDGDGHSDLILANAAAGSFSALLGLGNGTFRAPQEFAIDGDPKSMPAALALGDFDGDGRVDVAVAQLGVNDISVALRA